MKIDEENIKKVIKGHVHQFDSLKNVDKVDKNNKHFLRYLKLIEKDPLFKINKNQVK